MADDIAQDSLVRYDPDGYRLEDQVGFLLRKAYQRATSSFNDVMGGHAVTPTQLAALCKLDDLGATSQNELGRHTAMDPATIWGVVNRLIKRGWVSQAQDPHDGRLVILDLTPIGRAATREMKAVAQNVSDRTVAPLSAEEAGLLVELLRRIG